MTVQRRTTATVLPASTLPITAWLAKPLLERCPAVPAARPSIWSARPLPFSRLLPTQRAGVMAGAPPYTPMRPLEAARSSCPFSNGRWGDPALTTAVPSLPVGVSPGLAAQNQLR